MLEAKGYRAVDMVFTIWCDFIDLVRGYEESPKKTRVIAMYRSLMSRIVSCNWKRG